MSGRISYSAIDNNDSGGGGGNSPYEFYEATVGFLLRLHAIPIELQMRSVLCNGEWDVCSMFVINEWLKRTKLYELNVRRI